MTGQRRLRGIFGAAGLWGIGFAGVSALVAVAMAFFGKARPNGPGEFFNVVVSAMTAWAIIGTVAGTLFAVTIILVEPSRTLATLSSRRFALWGFTAGALLPVAVTLAFRLARHVSIEVDGSTLVVSLVLERLAPASPH